MKQMIKIMCLLAIAILLVMPVGGAITNISVNDSSFVSHTYKATENYMRFEYEVLLIALGVACLAISRAVKDAGDIFAVAAVIPIAMSAWFANYTTFESVEVIGTQVVFAQVVTPNPYLSIAMGVMTLIAVVNVIWSLLLKPVDSKTSEEQEE